MQLSYSNALTSNSGVGLVLSKLSGNGTIYIYLISPKIKTENRSKCTNSFVYVLLSVSKNRLVAGWDEKNLKTGEKKVMESITGLGYEPTRLLELRIWTLNHNNPSRPMFSLDRFP